MITGTVLLSPLIVLAVLGSSKRRKTVMKRLGVSSIPPVLLRKKSTDSENRPLWVHALSVGEVISAVPLVSGLKNRFGSREIVFSSSTLTGFEIASELFAGQVKGVFYFPYDFFVSVKYVVGKIRPKLVIIVETDIWPNFLFEIKKQRIPAILTNARLSIRSYNGYRRLWFMMPKVLSAFSKICTQSETDARRFAGLGVPKNRVTVAGNFKFDQKYDPPPENETRHLKSLLRINPMKKVFVAGSTHSSEESILLDAFSRIKRTLPDLFLVIAPRDPRRADSVKHLCESAGWSVGLWKALKAAKASTPFDIIVVDAIGLLTRLYALADIAFVGGSLVNRGGHNPLEPAAFSKPVLYGPHMSDFEDISQMLLTSGGAFQVHDAKDISKITETLLGDAEKAKAAGNLAFDVFSANKGAVENVLKEVELRL